MLSMKITFPSSGIMALIATLTIWSAYFTALRSGSQTSLTIFDLALLRFVLPAILLLPILFRARKKIAAIKKGYLLSIVVCGGSLYYLLSLLAAGFVPAVFGSLLVPGVLPFFVTLIAVLVYKQPLSQNRIIGLGIISVGVVLLVLPALGVMDYSTLTGIGLYLCGSLTWATYTISVRIAKLGGLETAAIVNSATALMLGIGSLVMDFDSNMFQAPWSEILPQLVVMGLFCGVFSVVTYGHAINELGAEMSACWGALTPALVAFLAWLVLGEALSMNTIMAMCLIVAGVIVTTITKNRTIGRTTGRTTNSAPIVVAAKCDPAS
jgi:drug/metabolite transporter (DMT)-like permease